MSMTRVSRRTFLRATAAGLADEGVKRAYLG